MNPVSYLLPGLDHLWGRHQEKHPSMLSKKSIVRSSMRSACIPATGVCDDCDDVQHGTLGRGRSGLVRVARWHGAEVALKIFYGHSNTAENEKAMHQVIACQP